jgi:hypothetical protein
MCADLTIGYMLLETTFLVMVFSAGLRAETLHTRRKGEHGYASYALDGVCGELAKEPFADTVRGFDNRDRSIRRHLYR